MKINWDCNICVLFWMWGFVFDATSLNQWKEALALLVLFLVLLGKVGKASRNQMNWKPSSIWGHSLLPWLAEFFSPKREEFIFLLLLFFCPVAHLPFKPINCSTRLCCNLNMNYYYFPLFSFFSFECTYIYCLSTHPPALWTLYTWLYDQRILFSYIKLFSVPLSAPWKVCFCVCMCVCVCGVEGSV